MTPERLAEIRARHTHLFRSWSLAGFLNPPNPTACGDCSRPEADHPYVTDPDIADLLAEVERQARVIHYLNQAVGDTQAMYDDLNGIS